MLIKCPYCGERPLEEFAILGDAAPVRPAGDDVEAWHDYVYLRDNLKGRMREHWHHAGGCRSWLIVERDNATHEIFAVSPAREGRNA
jgi:methylglutamate dehydrogenase subunit B